MILKNIYLYLTELYQPGSMNDCMEKSFLTPHSPVMETAVGYHIYIYTHTHVYIYIYTGVCVCVLGLYITVDTEPYDAQLVYHLVHPFSSCVTLRKIKLSVPHHPYV